MSDLQVDDELLELTADGPVGALLIRQVQAAMSALGRGRHWAGRAAAMRAMSSGLPPAATP